MRTKYLLVLIVVIGIVLLMVMGVGFRLDGASGQGASASGATIIHVNSPRESYGVISRSQSGTNETREAFLAKVRSTLVTDSNVTTRTPDTTPDPVMGTVGGGGDTQPAVQ